MLAVQKSIRTIRQRDLESNSEVLICEIRPNAKCKFVIVVFYRPPDFMLEYMKELKKSFGLSRQNQFEQIIICGDFNLPHIDWSTGVASTSDNIHTYFTKLAKYNYLWQMIDFPTQNNNVLDLILTSMPDKVTNLIGFDDILSTDHKLISFV
jgi:hypothetical protein